METKIRKQQAGVPAGGTTGQVATKASNADNDVVWANPPGAGSFQGSQATETTAQPSGSFGAPGWHYEAVEDAFYQSTTGGGNITKCFVKSADGIYQPVSISTSIPSGSLGLSFIYAQKYYSAKNDGLNNLIYDVYDLTTQALIGTTNIVGSILAGSAALTSCCATPDGRWVGSYCFNGVTRVLEADITSTLVFTVTNTFNPASVFGQSFTGAPVSWGTYKVSKANTNYIFQNEVYDYSTSGVPARLGRCFGIAANVICWGTTLTGKTIIMYQPGSGQQGNPSNSVPYQVYIRYLDLGNIMNWAGNALTSVTL